MGFSLLNNLHLPSNPISRRITTRRPISAGERFCYAVIEGTGCIRRLQISLDYRKPEINRNVIIRIYFDGQEIPFVEAPYGDFFGAMNNLQYYRVNTPFLSIKRWNTYTSYFPMPFANGARIELESNQDTPVYLHLDWHTYLSQQIEENRRFCSRFRREMPTQANGEDYLILDADGPGQLVGFFYAVNLLNSRLVSRWSHGGADNIYIDGQGENPGYLRGIGGEEVFGTGWAGGEYPSDSHLFSDMPYYVMEKGLSRERSNVDETGQELYSAFGELQQMVGYRFYVPDTINFRESIQVRFGCQRHDISSTAYWYADSSPRKFFKMPPWEKLKPGEEIKRGQFDIVAPSTGSWEIMAPLPMNVLDISLPANSDYEPNIKYGYEWLIQDYPAPEIVEQEALQKRLLWVKKDACHGFIDFNHTFRPPLSNRNTPTFSGVGLARAYLYTQKTTKAIFRISWDDYLAIQINEEQNINLGDHFHFNTQTIEVKLKSGCNRILLKNSNLGNPYGQVSNMVQLDHGTNVGGWAFAFYAETSDCQPLVPQNDIVLNEK